MKGRRQKKEAKETVRRKKERKKMNDGFVSKAGAMERDSGDEVGEVGCQFLCIIYSIFKKN